MKGFKNKIALILSIAILISLSVILYRCSTLDLKVKIGGDAVYKGERYKFLDIAYYLKLSNYFELNCKTPVVVGKTIGWGNGLPRGIVNVYASEYDTEKNALFYKIHDSYLFIKDGYELPDIFECRIYKVAIGDNYGDEEDLWESESDFFTLNQIIKEKTEKPDISLRERTQINLYFADYPYLKSFFFNVIHFEDKTYFYFKDGTVDVVNDEYFLVKDEYADLFQIPTE